MKLLGKAKAGVEIGILPGNLPLCHRPSKFASLYSVAFYEAMFTMIVNLVMLLADEGCEASMHPAGAKG